MSIYFVQFSVEDVSAENMEEAARKALRQLNRILKRGDAVIAEVIPQDDLTQEMVQITFRKRGYGHAKKTADEGRGNSAASL